MIRDVHKLTLCGLAMLAAALAICVGLAASAETFPERTVKLIVPVPPGGSTDAVARLVTLRMQTILGQPVIIENQPGAGGLIAARAVAAANPDGYTLLIGGIATVSTETMVLVINPKVPADTLDAFVRYAKASGSKLNYGSAPGITPHFVS